MHVTVCVCTRDRGGLVAGAIRSVLASTHQDFDLVVVDQSSADDTARAVERFARDSRLRYLHSRTRGVSRARNLAVAQARGPIVACTDDDCEVAPDWLETIVANFAHDPAVAQIQGEVLPPPGADPATVPVTCRIARRRRISSPWAKWVDAGIGANRAFRLDALREVGPFDESLGPGARFHGCEDSDMTYRVLRAGHVLLNAPEVKVTHRGDRSGAEGRMYMRRLALGVGAAYMKHLRCGDLAILPALLHEWFRYLSWRRLLTGRRPCGAARFGYFLYGMALSFGVGVDRRRRLYRA